MAILLGIDTGGTYTDAVLFDEDAGVIASAKSLTTKHDLTQGVRAAVDAVLPEPRPEIRLVSLSTTLATNAIVEGQGGSICLILVGQRPDALDRAGLRKVMGDDPVLFVSGGHRADGDERFALDVDAARAGILVHAHRVGAFAVASHFAVRNAAHECAIRDMVRELTGLPVTCSHELSSNLDAPRRALTAVLNARLIGLLQELILVVQTMLAGHGVRAPLMVVMGDGSLISAEQALVRPVETVLSGPAASVVGARYLSGRDDAYVVDIGGTTTDIALIRGGWPALKLEGATVGGWHTMVEAANVHTAGIGGDSEVRMQSGGLVVGPRRVVPLSLLATRHAPVIDTLRRQLEKPRPGAHDGRFAERLRAASESGAIMTTGERRLWDALAPGPAAVEALMASHPLERQLDRLVKKGLVGISAFTPSDAAHVLSIHQAWSREAARLGALLWLRRVATPGGEAGEDAGAFCTRVIDQLLYQSGEAVIAAALADEHGLLMDRGQTIARVLVDNALRPRSGERSLLDVNIDLRYPLIAIGASAHAYYPRVAERLGCPLEVPVHAAVCNAVGAVVSGVIQVVKALVTSPDQGRFRVHVRTGVRDFTGLDEALAHAEKEAAGLALDQARRGGTESPQVRLARRDRSASVDMGEEIFLESEIIATATGRPRLAFKARSRDLTP